MNPSLLKTALGKLLMRRMTLIFTLSLFLIISLSIFVLAPIYVAVSSDILYLNTPLPTLFDVLRTVADIAVLGISYGVLLYSLYRFSLKGSVRFLVLYGLFVLYKNIGNLFMTFITDGIPNDVPFMILSVAIYIILEFLQTALVVFLGFSILSKAKKNEETRMLAAEKAKKAYTPLYTYFPMQKLLSFKNPLQKAAFWMAAVPMSIRVISRIASDILIPFSEEVAEILIDIMWIVVYYSLDILGFGVVVYFAVLFLVLSFRKTDLKLAEMSTDRTELLP